MAASPGPATPTLAAGSTPSPAPPTPAPAPSAAPSAAAPSGATRGGTLALAAREPVRHLDVQDEVSPALSTWGPGIAYSRLLRFKSGPDVALPTLAVECDLCSRWEMEDPLTFVFTLRDGVRWQDVAPVNGRDLTASDVVFSYRRQAEDGRPNADLLRTVASVEAPDPSTVRIRLQMPDADFLASLADGHSKIVAPEAVAVRGDLREGPTVGTGPWVYQAESLNGPYRFVRNPSYFEEGLPLLDRLEVQVVADATARLAAYATGLLDVVEAEPEEWPAFRERWPGAPSVALAEPGAGLELVLNTARPPFEDATVRRAAFLAMDPVGAVEAVWGGLGYPALGLPAAAADWVLPWGEMAPRFGDPARARALLSGTGAALPIEMVLTVGDYGDAYLSHANRLADELRAVGFEVQPRVVSRRAFAEVAAAGGFHLLLGPMTPAATPNTYLFPVLHSRGALNTAGFRDADLDRLIEAQAGQYDPARRRDIVLDIQRRVLEAAYRFTPVTRVSVWVWQAGVRDFHPNLAGHEYAYWSRVWLDASG